MKINQLSIVQSVKGEVSSMGFFAGQTNNSIVKLSVLFVSDFTVLGFFVNLIWGLKKSVVKFSGGVVHEEDS